MTILEINGWVLGNKTFKEFLIDLSEKENFWIWLGVYSGALVFFSLAAFLFGKKTNEKNKGRRVFFWSIFGIIFIWIPTIFYAIGYFLSKNDQQPSDKNFTNKEELQNNNSNHRTNQYEDTDDIEPAPKEKKEDESIQDKKDSTDYQTQDFPEDDYHEYFADVKEFAEEQEKEIEEVKKDDERSLRKKRKSSPKSRKVAPR